jgi:hypothetical protein
MTAGIDDTDTAPLSFEADIKPLFRSGDRSSMSNWFDLWSATDVANHGPQIAERLQNGSMPCDGAWPPDQVALFQRWLDTGAHP